MWSYQRAFHMQKNYELFKNWRLFVVQKFILRKKKYKFCPFFREHFCLGSIYAALSCLVCIPPGEERPCLRGRSAGSFSEQRLVIEPNFCHALLLASFSHSKRCQWRLILECCIEGSAIYFALLLVCVFSCS